MTDENPAPSHGESEGKESTPIKKLFRHGAVSLASAGILEVGHLGLELLKQVTGHGELIEFVQEVDL
jgi:hypothetical protein